MVTLKAHGTVPLRSGRALLETKYLPADNGPGLLTLTLEDQETYESVDGTVRLDPLIADEYGLIEFRTAACFVICGAQAVVGVDISNLSLVSSVGLEFHEAETVGSPWHSESEAHRSLVLATERRVWCLDERGAIRWTWACATDDRDRWITGAPVIEDGSVRVPLRTMRGEQTIELDLADGLPRPV